MAQATSPLIELAGLTKRYGSSATLALDDVSLQVNTGEVYGFLGPNGAGKSTTIRTLMNFIQPTEGQATILGKDIVTDSVEIKRSVGYLSSDMAMYPKMTGHQFLDYLAELQPTTEPGYRRELIKRLRAEPTKRLGDLSRGNRQKFAIIQAFMHKPDVLILDEPTSGLDPLMQEVFYDIVRDAKTRGAAVFMSSHIFGEVQKICDRVGIIRDGKLIAERDIAEMAKEAAHTLEITFASAPPLTELKKIKGVTLAAHNEHQATVHVHGELSALLGALSRYDVTQIEVHQLDLEELFMHYYRDERSQ
ncbi:ABC transporter ATP-binding protein [soil metagenome]